MNHPPLAYHPQFDECEIDRHLQQLILPEMMHDPDLNGKLRRLQRRFEIFATTAPVGLWGKGLILTEEMCRQTEFYLPMEEIVSLFTRFFSRILTFSPCLEASLLHTTDNWLRFLDLLPSPPASANPVGLLQGLLHDSDARTAFIFANFLPARYGGGFDRYPGQKRFITSWLGSNRHRLADGISCLDTACGSGEGTYELATLLLASGFSPATSAVQGTTLEPLELFAAAHAYFPHDPHRQQHFRCHLQPLMSQGMAHIHFSREDLLTARGGSYDLILCNGVLGGPFLHDAGELAGVMERLAGRLAPGGVLLAADKFHGGWKKRLSSRWLEELLEQCGLQRMVIPEGIAAVKGGC